MTQDEMHAENRKYRDTRIILVPLPSGNVAIYNNAGEFCAFVSGDATYAEILAAWKFPSTGWRGPERPRPTLEELGL